MSSFMSQPLHVTLLVSSWNFRNDTNHHDLIHDINEQATFFISLTTTFETGSYGKLWNIKYMQNYRKGSTFVVFPEEKVQKPKVTRL